MTYSNWMKVYKNINAIIALRNICILLVLFISFYLQHNWDRCYLSMNLIFWIFLWANSGWNVWWQLVIFIQFYPIIGFVVWSGISLSSVDGYLTEMNGRVKKFDLTMSFSSTCKIWSTRINYYKNSIITS